MRAALVWAFAVLMLAIVALPCYLCRRRHVPFRFSRSASSGRAAGVVDDRPDLDRWEGLG